MPVLLCSCVWLIPAHAGKTHPALTARICAWAHPRSRGENHASAAAWSGWRGSSPLTRGKLECVSVTGELAGLIPAHAGKTMPHIIATACAAAHPRSRGENAMVTGAAFDPKWLIPAHAGKTVSALAGEVDDGAHPRSRGENQDENIVNLSKQGSSPLTRGKPRLLRAPAAPKGLIPAHAGKTKDIEGHRCSGRAHPRSRGENSYIPGGDTGVKGSSPLTRGKPRVHLGAVQNRGLIPAHAGKTSSAPPPSPPTEAHPRSRGENSTSWSTPSGDMGSSPLTRGKLMICSPGDR